MAVGSYAQAFHWEFEQREKEWRAIFDKQRVRIAALESALKALPLWTPEPREGRYLDPLYGWVGSEYYPTAVLVDADKLVAAKKVLEDTQ